MAEDGQIGEQYEEAHVHQVYEQIASHFSSTRYKPWPIIERFLRNLPDGSVGLDVGCGNGKYLAVNPNIFIVGSDRSSNLINIAKQHPPHSVVLADMLSLPHPDHSFNFAISIAAIHHLSTPERRIEVVKALLQTLQPDSKALIYVWALEQESSRRGWSSQDDQDVMVPWVKRSKGQPDETYHRYYHLYRQGELENDIGMAGGVVVESGYEKDNWWAITKYTAS